MRLDYGRAWGVPALSTLFWLLVSVTADAASPMHSPRVRPARPPPAPRAAPGQPPHEEAGREPQDEDEPAEAQPAEAQEKHVALTLGAFYYELLGAGVGATVGVHVGPSTLIEVDGYVAGSIFPTQGSRTIGLRIQQFAGSHLYIRGGARFRRLVVKDLLDFDFGELRERTLQTDIGVDVAAGNRWRFDSAIVGLDWAGVYVPLTAFTTNRRVIDPSNNELLVDDDLAAHHRPDVRIGYIYVGAEF